MRRHWPYVIASSVLAVDVLGNLHESIGRMQGGFTRSGQSFLRMHQDGRLLNPAAMSYAAAYGASQVTGSFLASVTGSTSRVLDTVS